MFLLIYILLSSLFRYTISTETLLSIISSLLTLSTETLIIFHLITFNPIFLIKSSYKCCLEQTLFKIFYYKWRTLLSDVHCSYFSWTTFLMSSVCISPDDTIIYSSLNTKSDWFDKVKVAAHPTKDLQSVINCDNFLMPPKRNYSLLILWENIFCFASTWLITISWRMSHCVFSG